MPVIDGSAISMSGVMNEQPLIYVGLSKKVRFSAERADLTAGLDVSLAAEDPDRALATELFEFYQWFFEDVVPTLSGYERSPAIRVHRI